MAPFEVFRLVQVLPWLVGFVVVTVLLAPTIVDAKHVSGDFKLKGDKTEVVLASFAVMPLGALFEATLTSDTVYENEMAVKVRAYRDTEWDQYRKEPLCTKKIQFAKKIHAVAFYLNESTKKWTADIAMEIDNLRRTSDDPHDKALLDHEDPRSHYWYFVVDDCSLEQYYHDNKVPKIHFELDVRSYRGRLRKTFTHLSADERVLIDMHGITFILSGLVALGLLATVLWRLHDKSNNHSVHAAVLWIGGAAALDATATLCELVHLSTYQANGIGFYFMDALSAHMEACCDAAIMIFLLSIAAGWTLPSSVVHVNNNGLDGNPVQTLIASLAHPISQGIRGPSGILAAIIFGLHSVLAQWGRVYDDDFESYHELEHWPGRLLMGFRCVMGLLFVVAVQQTILSSSSSVPQNLKKFYILFSIAGFFWFESLPVWTWFCSWALPYHLRRPCVFAGTALLQSISILILAWLVTTHSTAYHQYSHMTSSRDTLSDSLSSQPSTGATSSDGFAASSNAWLLGKKAKVRLD